MTPRDASDMLWAEFVRNRRYRADRLINPDDVRRRARVESRCCDRCEFMSVSTTIRTEGAVVMAERRNQLAALEGHQVNVAMRDGSRIDDCQLVSVGRTRVASIWLFVNGTDTFVAFEDVADIWEVSA